MQQPHIVFHDLRTLNITNSLLSGVDPKTLIGITGHTILQMIDKHYAVLVSKAVSEASQTSGDYIDALLREAMENSESEELKKDNIVPIAAE